MKCKQCQKSFEITDLDRKLCEKYDVPEPEKCPLCRLQLQHVFRNELNLYKRDCDKCQKSMISIYSTDKPYTVYCGECYWGDEWSATDYGQEVDFSRPFFEQMNELLHKVPMMGTMVFNSTNCEYNSYMINSKDCYLSARVESETCLYSYLVVKGHSIVDCLYSYQSEKCYECVDIWNCYNCDFCQLCKNCSDCVFCYDCIGSKNCFGSVGLRNAEYVFFNKQCTQEQYEHFREEYSLKKYGTLKNIREKFYQEVILKHPLKAASIDNSENATGDYIVDSKNIVQCFDVERSEDCSWSWAVEYSKDINNSSFIYYGENCYENISNSRSMNIFFTFSAMDSSDLTYCIQNFNNCHDNFGSISVRQTSNSILNKVYSKEKYTELKTKVIEHMKKTGEWGQFFPASLSCFAYNESAAMDFFPLTKEEALAQGFSWKNPDEKHYRPQTVEIPDDLNKVEDSICSEILACIDCGKNYKMIPRELTFYRDKQLAPPRECPSCRMTRRRLQRNPRQLWERNCDKCEKKIETSYAADRPETVYCEECYLKNIY